MMCRFKDFQQQVNQLKIGGTRQDETYGSGFLQDSFGENWEQKNPENNIFLNRHFIRHLFSRDGMVADLYYQYLL